MHTPVLASLLLLIIISSSHSLNILATITKFLFEGERLYANEPDDVVHMLDEYDFIIVGAGTAGCILANRLTEVAEWRVLLIEAGGNENFVMDVPVLATRLQFTDANWKYRTEPQPSGCLGMQNGQCHWPRGKVMGGSSVLHSMIHTRGHRKDYDNWEALGNPGWGYESVLPYFKKYENMEIPSLGNDTTYHSTQGEMNINYAKWATPLGDAFLEAGKETGGKVVDYNGATCTGYSKIQFTLRNGTRLSSSRAFLHPIRDRPNFHVKKRTLVTKILIDPYTKQAYGVEFSKGGRKYHVQAKREVILSAGALNSPMVLMWSGIGPARHLQKLGIDTVQNLKVGYNLQDHIALGGLTYLVNQSVSIRNERVVGDWNTFWNYMEYHDGPLSAPTGTEAIAFIDTRNPTADDGHPDLELLFVSGSFVSDTAYRNAFAISDEIYETVYKPIEKHDTFMVFPMVLLPKSRGRVMLRDKYPSSKPLLYPNYFANPYDSDIILKGVRKVQQLVNTKAFQKYGSRIHDIPFPNCARHPFDSDQYWICAMKTVTQTIYHQCGTCKMGPTTDPDAVVDSRLRVHGLKGLRVIDASVIPVMPAAHTNAPTMMIAEKGADMIKEDWGRTTYRRNSEL